MRVFGTRPDVHIAVDRARAAYGNAVARTHAARSAGGRTKEWIDGEVKKAVEEARSPMEFVLDGARSAVAGKLEDARREADGGSLERGAVSEMREKLAPILTGLSNDREGLIRFYRKRFGNSVARFVIGDAIEGAIDSLPDAESYELLQGYEKAKRDLAEMMPESERMALADVEALSEIAAYVEDSAWALNYDLSQLTAERPGVLVTDNAAAVAFSREEVRARINDYERKYRQRAAS